jgi:hypothetical protein
VPVSAQMMHMAAMAAAAAGAAAATVVGNGNGNDNGGDGGGGSDVDMNVGDGDAIITALAAAAAAAAAAASREPWWVAAEARCRWMRVGSKCSCDVHLCSLLSFCLGSECSDDAISCCSLTRARKSHDQYATSHPTARRARGCLVLCRLRRRGSQVGFHSFVH